MSNKRAELRRAAVKDKKADKRYNLTNADIERLREEISHDAVDRALEIITVCSLLTLYDEFDFRAMKNGKGRLDRYLDRLKVKVECLYDKNSQVTIIDYIDELERITGLKVISDTDKELYRNVE